MSLKRIFWKKAVKATKWKEKRIDERRYARRFVRLFGKHLPVSNAEAVFKDLVVKSGLEKAIKVDSD